MKTLLRGFVWSVTLFDAAFAYHHGQCFEEWELNPLAVRLGLYGAILLRLGAVSFAGVVGRLVKGKWFPSLIAVINAGVMVLYFR